MYQNRLVSVTASSPTAGSGSQATEKQNGTLPFFTR